MLPVMTSGIMHSTVTCVGVPGIILDLPEITHHLQTYASVDKSLADWEGNRFIQVLRQAGHFTEAKDNE